MAYDHNLTPAKNCFPRVKETFALYFSLWRNNTIHKIGWDQSYERREKSAQQVESAIPMMSRLNDI
jgi:hypothetical protein